MFTQRLLGIYFRVALFFLSPAMFAYIHHTHISSSLPSRATPPQCQ